MQHLSYRVLRIKSPNQRISVVSYPWPLFNIKCCLKLHFLRHPAKTSGSVVAAIRLRHLLKLNTQATFSRTSLFDKSRGIYTEHLVGYSPPPPGSRNRCSEISGKCAPVQLPCLLPPHRPWLHVLGSWQKKVPTIGAGRTSTGQCWVFSCA